LAAWLGISSFFFIGRRHGQPWLGKHDGWRAKIERVDKLMDRFGWIALLGFRFAYGLRAVTPFALGLSTLSFARFAVFNVIGAVIWAVVVGGAGFVFGSTLERFMDRLIHYEHFVVAGILAAGLLIWLVRHWWKRR